MKVTQAEIERARAFCFASDAPTSALSHDEAHELMAEYAAHDNAALRTALEYAKKVLGEMAQADYRGNRHPLSVMAFHELIKIKRLEEAGGK